MTEEELEQFILAYMDEHIEERIAQLTDDVIDQRIRQYMEENGAAIEDSGPTGEVPHMPICIWEMAQTSLSARTH